MATSQQSLQLLRLPDAAARLAISLPQMRRLVSAGVIPLHKFGKRCVRVAEADVQRYALSGRRSPERSAKTSG